MRRVGRSLGCLSSRTRGGTLVLGAGVLACGLLSAPAARAEVHLAMGSRLEPIRYTKSFFPNATALTAMRPSGAGPGTEDFQSTALAPYLAMFFAQKYGIVLGLDMAYAKLGGSLNTDPAQTEENSYLTFGIGLGFKSYFTQLKGGRVSPYLYVDIYKYFASITTTSMITTEKASAQAALHSPTGGTIALGAEYFFSPSFSIGSEIFGLKIQGVSTSWKETDGATSQSASFTQVAFYTGITFNYRFHLAGGAKPASEDSDEAKRHAAEPVIPVPPPPPVVQPVPEAVD